MEQQTTIFQKLIEAQAEFASVFKGNRANAGSARYRYADINDVLDAVRPVLNKHGLFLVQRIANSQEATKVLSIETLVFDASGASISSGLLYTSTDGLMQKGCQALGSATTYLRRYQLVAFLGLALNEDDDGQSAVHQQASRPQSKPQAVSAPLEKKSPIPQELWAKAVEFAEQGEDSIKGYFAALKGSPDDALFGKEERAILWNIAKKANQ